MQQISHAYRTIPFTKVAQMSREPQKEQKHKKSAPNGADFKFPAFLKTSGFDLTGSEVINPVCKKRLPFLELLPLAPFLFK